MSQNRVKNMKKCIGKVEEGNILIHSDCLKQYHNFSYQLLFKPTLEQQIIIRNSQNPEILQIELPINPQFAKQIFTSIFSIFLILYSKTVTIERQTSYKMLINQIFTQYDLQVQWRKGLNYYKATILGKSQIIYYDFSSLENLTLQNSSLTKKGLSHMKTRNAYFYCMQLFEQEIQHKLLSKSCQEEIQHNYDNCIQELSVVYSGLAAWNRVGSSGKKIKQISWSVLKSQIDKKLIENNTTNCQQQEMDEIITSNIQAVIQNKYSIQLSKWKHQYLTIQFYSKLCHSIASQLQLSEKCLIFVDIFTNKIFEDFGMKAPNLQMKQIIKNNYCFNKKVREINKKVEAIQKNHQNQKDHIFKNMKEKQQQIAYLKSKVFSLTQQKEEKEKKEKQNKEENKQNTYFDKKNSTLKKLKDSEINGKEIKNNLDNHNAKDVKQGSKTHLLNIRKKSVSQKHLLKNTLALNNSQRVNIEKKYKNQKNNNTSKISQKKH